MKIVGCDLHTRYQQIAMLDQEAGRVPETMRVPHSFAHFANEWVSSPSDCIGITVTL